MPFFVTKKAQRPADMNGKCFYCGQPIGAEHRGDCVLINKMVKVRMTVEYEIEVPAHWETHMVEFHRNGSSWCCDNTLDELKKLAEENGCLCGMMNFTCLDDRGEAYLDE